MANWFDGFAREHGAFEPVLVDLADFTLPVYDEPNHPRLRQYAHEHTKRWSASVDAADAYVFVTPEYNYFAPPALVNAMDYVLPNGPTSRPESSAMAALPAACVPRRC